MYDLYSKTVKGIEPSLDGFAITNASVSLTSTHALLLRFRRSFDATFTLALEQVSWLSRIQLPLGRRLVILRCKSRAITPTGVTRESRLCSLFAAYHTVALAVLPWHPGHYGPTPHLPSSCCTLCMSHLLAGRPEHCPRPSQLCQHRDQPQHPLNSTQNKL